MNETSKSIFSKIKDARYSTRYLVGHGVDIGAGNDGLHNFAELFPLMKSCRPWDLEDGDAQYMQSVSDNSYDFVHSSHCLEHMNNPVVALNNWLRILKVGGHLICTIPDEDLYEQGYFPSRYNADHKFTFTIYKKRSWSFRSINIFELLAGSDFDLKIIKVELLDATYRYSMRGDSLPPPDQSASAIGECAIEIVLQKV